MASTKRIRKAESNDKVLAAIHPNAGVAAKYQARLDAEIEAMHKSLMRFLVAAYRANSPEMASDASPASVLQVAFRRLARRWQRRWDDLAVDLGRWFGTAAKDRSDAALKTALKDGGFAIEWKMTAPMNDAYQAVIGENVSLIKTISQEHLADVERMLMESVSVGRDIGGLTKALEHRYGLTRKRASLIARTEHGKASAVFQRVRQREIGITRGLWTHSSAGKTQRASHVAMNNKEYDIEKGALLDGIICWPGTEPNCRCVGRSIVPGFSMPAHTKQRLRAD